jgi:hypothetical protein
MPKRWTHTEAFAHFDARPRNVQWSWSARSEDGQAVVVTFWQDQFSRRDNRLTYTRPAAEPKLRRRPGFSELMKNLTWARDHCAGRFNVIVAKAKDVNAEPRSIDECFPSKIVMRLIEFDPDTGAFSAEAEGA